jgi:predicted nucleotidyltransferase/HEPN domain-containing protein
MLRRDHSRTARAERELARGCRPSDLRTMKTSLDHLPAGKQRELAFVVEVLREEFAKEVSTRWSKHLKDGQILKVILFGSYARGDWVEDPVGRYFSDYDLLIVVDNDKLTDMLEFWETAEKRLLAELSSGQRLRTPVNFIVHSLNDINAQLERGRYFFMDILRDGIALVEIPGHPFVDAKPLAAATALEEAEGYFEQWTESAAEFLDDAFSNYERRRFKKGAFELHQAAEHLYNGFLLVLTFYTPKSHNLVRLRSLAEPLDARLASVWPAETKFQRRAFELLRAAYVKARYSRHYKISAEELAWLLERVGELQALVKAICEAQLAKLRDAADRQAEA